MASQNDSIPSADPKFTGNDPNIRGKQSSWGNQNFASSMTKSEGDFVGISLEASLARSSSYETWQLEADQKNSNIFK